MAEGRMTEIMTETGGFNNLWFEPMKLACLWLFFDAVL